MKTSTFSSKVALCAIGLSVANFAQAQLVINSPTALKTACETSPGHVVNVSSSIKVANVLVSASPLQVNTPCTIVLLNESKVEFEKANLQFMGPLSIQSAGKGEMVSVNSAIKAPSVSVNLGGNGSQISMSQSALQATAGSLTMTLGLQAKMELYGIFNNANANSLSATGIVNISSGQNFTASIADMGVTGNQGVRIASSGPECLLKLEKVVFRSSLGSAEVISTGNKSLLESKESGFYVAGSTTINYSGGETTIKLSEIGFGGTAFNLPQTGGVSISAAEGANNFGKIEMSDIRSYGITGGFSVVATPNGQSGGVKLEKSTITAGGDMLFETGQLGTTEVKENALTSSTKITIKTGLQGNCVSTPNRTLSAPLVLSCQPMLMARVANVYEISEMPDLSVYPNPSNDGSMNIKLKQVSESGNVLLTDFMGNVIKRWTGTSAEEISVNNLKSGTYTVQYVDQKLGTKKSTKFIVE